MGKVTIPVKRSARSGDSSREKSSSDRKQVSQTRPGVWGQELGESSCGRVGAIAVVGSRD